MNNALLCIDCGNTRLKWGLRGGQRWLAQGALELAALDQLDAQLPRPPQRIVACNVAGADADAAIAALANRHSMPLSWVRASASCCGVSNGYDNPAQLGADRWAALVGARAVHGAACLVVGAGTATTIDVLDANGMFRGGLILPGLELMRSALARATAGLPLATGGYAEVPRNTDDAIMAGALHATLGAIERLFRQVAAQPGATCLLAGGAAAELAPHLALPLRRVDHLVLEGLGVIAESNDV